MGDVCRSDESDARFLGRGTLFSGGGGLVSTMQDYLKFARMLLGTGQGGGRADRECRIVATLDNKPVAACGIKRVNDRDCELVRLYCRPEGRGHQLGRKLSEAAQTYVKFDGCTRLVLSTEPIMKHAVRLYKDMGFVDIKNYADAPSACSKYMALEL